MGEQVAALGVDSLVVDTESGRLRLGLAAQLAEVMNAPCVGLEQLDDGSLLARWRSQLRVQQR
jgi:Mg-chelatase subunit ChlD